MDGVMEEQLKVTVTALAYQWFSRGLAVLCLLFGLSYWVRLIGYYQGDLWRFDLMPPHWQVAAVSLAVLFPLAASGLWMLASWGPVIWFIAAVVETIMYAGFPELYGDRSQAVIGHGLILILLLAFQLVFFLERRRRSDAA